MTLKGLNFPVISVQNVSLASQIDVSSIKIAQSLFFTKFVAPTNKKILCQKL